MKKLHKALLASLMTLAVGFSAIGLSRFNNREVKEASASRTKSVTGLYRKITDASQLTVDKTVVLVSEYGDVLQDCGGNPAYLYTTKENINLSNNGDYLFANNAYITELTVQPGTAENSFAFLGNYYLGWHSGDDTHHTGYIGYDYRGSGIEGGSIDYIHDGVGIGYFKDGTGLKKNIDANTSFTASFSDGHIHLHNVGGHGDLGFTDYYNRRFCLAVAGAVDLYEKIEVAAGHVEDQPTQKTFRVGERVDLSGMSVYVSFTDSTNADINYTNNEKLFQHDDFVVYDSDGHIDFSFAGELDLYATVSITSNSALHIKVTESMGDYRGNYIFAGYDEVASEAEYSAVYQAIGFQRTENGESGYNYNLKTAKGTVNSDNVFTTSSDFANFQIVKINGKYYVAKTFTSPAETRYLGSSGGDPVLLETATDANAMDVEYDSVNHCAFLKLGNNYLIYSGGFFFNNTEEDRVQLYKQELSDDEYASVTTFVNNFQNATSVCIPDGKNLNLTTENWAVQASAFAALTPGAQGFIAGTSYTHNQESYGSLEDIVDRYDYIISKYNQFNDFMFRKTLNVYENNFNASYITINGEMTDNTVAAAIVVLIAAIPLVIIPVVIIRKKQRD